MGDASARSLLPLFARREGAAGLDALGNERSLDRTFMHVISSKPRPRKCCRNVVRSSMHPSMRAAHVPFRSAFHTSSRLASRIRLSPPLGRTDVQAWRAAIEPFLPAHLRAQSSSTPDLSSTVTASDLSFFLNKAQDASLDLLGHLGLVEGQWHTAVWIAKKLAEDGRRSMEPTAPLDPSETMLWPEAEAKAHTETLNATLDQPLCTQRALPLRKLDATLDDLTSAPGSIDVQHTVTKRALGQPLEKFGQHDSRGRGAG